MGKRRQHSAEFKARVALEAVKGPKTVIEPCFDDPPNTTPNRPAVSLPNRS